MWYLFVCRPLRLRYVWAVLITSICIGCALLWHVHVPAYRELRHLTSCLARRKKTVRPAYAASQRAAIIAQCATCAGVTACMRRGLTLTGSYQAVCHCLWLLHRCRIITQLLDMRVQGEAVWCRASLE